jgi:hypothetical protein
MVSAAQLRIKIVPFGVVLVYTANYATKINNFFFLFIFCVQMYRYSFKRNVTNQCIIFKRNSLGRFIHCIYVLIIVLILLSTTNCYQEDNAIASTSSHIARTLYVNYFFALILTLNFKQTRVTKTFYKIVYALPSNFGRFIYLIRVHKRVIYCSKALA